MFKLYSKIKYIFPLTAGRQLASKEPERAQSLSITTTDVYYKEAPMKKRVFTTHLVTPIASGCS